MLVFCFCKEVIIRKTTLNAEREVSIFRERVMLELTDIEEELPECFGGRGAFIFQSQDKIQKYVYINPGETLQCYFKEEFLNEIIKVVEKIATQTKYELYELGE